MRTLEFELPIKPMPHQSVRFTKRGIAYKPKNVGVYQSEIINLILEMLPCDFEIIPKGTPIQIDYIHYCYAYPKSTPKKNRKVHSKTTKPDLQDNLNKAFFDALEGVLFEQDQNICYIAEMKKYYQEKDCIKFKISY